MSPRTRPLLMPPVVDGLGSGRATSPETRTTSGPTYVKSPLSADFSISQAPAEAGQASPLASSVRAGPRRRQTIDLGVTTSLDSLLDDTVQGEYAARPMVRRRSAPSGAADFRYLNFQRFRETLWRRGAFALENITRADVFIVPVELTRSLRSAAGLNNSHGLASPAPLGQKLTVRVIIRSKGRPPIGLKRSFDVEALRATVPEPMPSPRTPGLGLRTPISLLSRPGRHCQADRRVP